MKIYIIYQTKDVPSGGGNQFLKALSLAFSRMGVWALEPDEADAFLFNSHHCIDDVLQLKLKYPSKPFFHRIDGPMKLYNTRDDRRDDQTYWINEKIADGTIFQSEWSNLKNLEEGITLNGPSTVIFNAPNKDIFNPASRRKITIEGLPNLVATSWSDNIKKGFETYRFLDGKYVGKLFNMTFIGRSPFEFKNIVQKPPMDSRRLAQELKRCDIYITASQADPCSNSLIEALTCGLPAIVLNDGGHPEIVGRGGCVFDKVEEIPGHVKRIMASYSSFQQGISLPDIDAVANQYLDFMVLVSSSLEIGRIRTVTASEIKAWKKQKRSSKGWRRFFRF